MNGLASIFFFTSKTFSSYKYRKKVASKFNSLILKFFMPLFSAKVRKVMELLHRSMYNHLCFRSETIISTAPIFATVYTLICVGLRSYLR